MAALNTLSRRSAREGGSTLNPQLITINSLRKPVRAETRLTSLELPRPLVRLSAIQIVRADINCYDRVAIHIEYDSEIRLDFGGVNDATIASGKLLNLVRAQA